MTRVRKLYKTWCKENKQYFRHGNLKEDRLQEAKNSLLLYLRTNNVTITEAQFAATETTQLWDVAMYFASYLTGSITGSIATKTYTFGSAIIWGLVGIALLYYPLKWMIWKYTKDLNLSANTLLQITLECYQNIYSTEMCTDAKPSALFGGQVVLIPCHVEELYEQKMRNPQYYRNAYLVSIHTGEQDFEYIWYTNTNYKKLNPNAYQKFLDACEEQIGMKWNSIDKTQIEIKDLTCHTNPTSV